MTFNNGEGYQQDGPGEKLPAWITDLGESTAAAVKWAVGPFTPEEQGERQPSMVSALGALPLQRMAEA